MKMITKELVESLFDEKITRKEYNKILSLIANRVDEIWRYICSISHRTLDWWAFSNDVYDGEGNGSSGGEFNPEHDKEWIEIIGESTCISGSYLFNDGFPTDYLWAENYQKLVKKEIALAEENDKKQKQKVKKKKEDKATKKVKLTPEALKCIKFK
jgi:hypothetical protein